MSLFWWCFIAYWVIAIGVFRWWFSEQYVEEVKRTRRTKGLGLTLDAARSRALRDPGLWASSVLFGMSWPLLLIVGVCVGAAYVVVLWPAKLVGPLVAWWFLRPANRKTDKEFATS